MFQTRSPFRSLAVAHHGDAPELYFHVDKVRYRDGAFIVEEHLPGMLLRGGFQPYAGERARWALEGELERSAAGEVGRRFRAVLLRAFCYN